MVKHKAASATQWNAMDGCRLFNGSLVGRTHPYTQVGQIATVVRYDEVVLDGAHEYDLLVNVSPRLPNQEAIAHANLVRQPHR